VVFAQSRGVNYQNCSTFCKISDANERQTRILQRGCGSQRRTVYFNNKSMTILTPKLCMHADQSLTLPSYCFIIVHMLN
jgi:hypothetical protein